MDDRTQLGASVGMGGARAKARCRLCHRGPNELGCLVLLESRDAPEGVWAHYPCAERERLIEAGVLKPQRAA